MSRARNHNKKGACPELSRRVFVAMSGGVDSSVAAGLLKKQGYDVTGVYMKCWSQGSSDALGMNMFCSSEQDAEDARKAAEVLGIPFYIFDFEKKYKDSVVKYMIDGYKKGITPNPDVMCNKEIKFGWFLKKALSLGADYVATGHYVRIASQYVPDGTGVAPLQRRGSSTSRSDGSDKGRRPSPSELRSCRTKHIEKLSLVFSLFGARDKNKDQSYFLWTLTQEQLKYCLFPIGDYLKSEVRKMAKKFGLPNADKKDSQGLCFVGKVNVKNFLSKYIRKKKGLILDTNGNVVGKHDGACFYTIGQRHGLDLGKRGQSGAEPYYVADTDVKKNIIIVAEGENDPALYKKEVELKNINLINPIIPLIRANKGIKIMARVRYRQPLIKAVLVKSRKRPTHQSESWCGAQQEVSKLKNMSRVSYKLIFTKLVKFVASGQSAVFYLPAEALAKEGGDEKWKMLGGGIIK